VMSARPGTVLQRIEVPFARPRDEATREKPEFAALAGRVRGLLRHHNGTTTTAVKEEA
jgi:NitT/TauT family transport system ATP-binding protein